MDRRDFLSNTALAAGALTIPVKNLSSPYKKNIRFAFLTDVHVKPAEAAEKGMRAAYRHVNALKHKVDFIINGGDAIMDGLAATKEKTQAQWDVWDRILNDENKLPIYHTIGNHDVWGWQLKDQAVKSDPLYDKNWVIQQHKMLGRYYSFEKANWKFIALDSTQENNGGYIARLDEEQYNWLEKELAATAADQHICIFSHIPIVSFCSAMFFDDHLPNGDWKLSRALLHVDARKIISLFKNHKNIRCCLSGHIHLQDEVEYFGVQYFCNGAISGNWWSGAFKGFDPAYAIFEFDTDGKVKREFVSYA